jgi:hypothetical protein
MIEKKFARLPLVIRNAKQTNADAISPDRMLTVSGVQARGWPGDQASPGYR